MPESLRTAHILPASRGPVEGLSFSRDVALQDAMSGRPKSPPDVRPRAIPAPGRVGVSMVVIAALAAASVLLLVVQAVVPVPQPTPAPVVAAAPAGDAVLVAGPATSIPTGLLRLAPPSPVVRVTMGEPATSAPGPAPRAVAAASTSTPAAKSQQEMVGELLPSVVMVLAGNSSGSGVVVDRGLVITNAHVVEGAQSFRVGSRHIGTLAAELVKIDADRDLALLRVAGLGVKPAALGDVNSMDLGQPLIAIGYALGMDGDPSVTRGVYSGRRDVRGVDHLQTDAPINPGNSGGPLVDADGRIVGITTFHLQRAGNVQLQGLNFAVSVLEVKRFLRG